MDTSGNNVYGITDYDSAVAWAHEYTDEQSVLNTTCQNCHGVNSEGGNPNPDSVPADWTNVNIGNDKFMEHAERGRGSRQMMDKAEMEVNGGSVFMDTGTDGNGGLCVACHNPYDGKGVNAVSCVNGEWLNHLTEGRASAPAFEKVSTEVTGGTCW